MEIKFSGNRFGEATLKLLPSYNISSEWIDMDVECL